MARWFPDDEIIVLGDSTYGGRSVLSHLPPNVHLISRVHPDGALYKPAPPKAPEDPRGPLERKAIVSPAWPSGPPTPSNPGRGSTSISSGCMPRLDVKTIQALYYKSGRDRLLTIVLVHDVEGKRPDQMFYCTKLDWTARQVLSAYACRWAIECTFEYCKQFLGIGGPGQSPPQGGRADGADGDVHLQPGGGVVPSGRAIDRCSSRSGRGTRRRSSRRSPTC